MIRLPAVAGTLVVRTDFTDDETWERVCTALDTPTEEGFLPDVALVDDAWFEDLGWTDVADVLPAAYQRPLLVLADAECLASPELPLLVACLDDDQADPLTLRVPAAELWSIENNLSLRNMDFDEFTGAADADGVFRGFA